jgi:hypothetical protein
MANPYRGEVPLDLDGVPHTLRLSLAALARLERDLSAPDLSALITMLVTGKTGAGQMNLVLREALQAGEGIKAREAETLLSHARPLTLARAYVDLMRATFADQNGHQSDG